MSDPMACLTCGRQIEPNEPHYTEVVGWAKPGRGAGGVSGSSLVLRKATGRVRCAGCVVGETHGVHANQMELG